MMQQATGVAHPIISEKDSHAPRLIDSDVDFEY